ncbi:hypothetical protein RvY_14780 [Ramazzottius varieornatus]|uniref:Uncharacterized protein n=1 Tax=Ramazzottius varieornatus TaxID=947166 RepID=A0A1D1VU31_RAMVA|nr:hypothetical protein RvY_14780 [Ramazzottius varieornatus]
MLSWACWDRLISWMGVVDATRGSRRTEAEVTAGRISLPPAPLSCTGPVSELRDPIFIGDKNNQSMEGGMVVRSSRVEKNATKFDHRELYREHF